MRCLVERRISPKTGGWIGSMKLTAATYGYWLLNLAVLYQESELVARNKGGVRAAHKCNVIKM